METPIVPDRPTILYLLTHEMFTACFRAKDIQRLEERVSPIREPMADPEDIPSKDVLAEADIILTCWGSPPVKGEILAAATRLKFLQHSAGSVRHLVDDVARPCLRTP